MNSRDWQNAAITTLHTTILNLPYNFENNNGKVHMTMMLTQDADMEPVWRYHVRGLTPSFAKEVCAVARRRNLERFVVEWVEGFCVSGNWADEMFREELWGFVKAEFECVGRGDVEVSVVWYDDGKAW